MLKLKTDENAVENELENYFRKPCPSLVCTTLGWWKVNTQRFPRLEKLTKSTCIFQGLLYLQNKGFLLLGLLQITWLAPEHINMLFFLNKNHHYSCDRTFCFRCCCVFSLNKTLRCNFFFVFWGFFAFLEGKTFLMRFLCGKNVGVFCSWSLNWIFCAFFGRQKED